MPNRIRHVYGLQREEADIEEDRGDDHRPQVTIATDEARAVEQFGDEALARRGRRAHVRQADDQQHRMGGQRRREAVGPLRADPVDERRADRGAGRVRGAARELDRAVRPRERRAADERGNQRRRGHAVRDGPARADETEHRERRQRQRMRGEQRERGGKRERAQALCGRHDPFARMPIRPDAERNRKQQKRQRLRRLQQAGAACARAERQHGDERRHRKADLLSRLRGEIRQREAPKCNGKAVHRSAPFGIDRQEMPRTLRERAAPHAPFIADQSSVLARPYASNNSNDSNDSTASNGAMESCVSLMKAAGPIKPGRAPYNL